MRLQNNADAILNRNNAEVFIKTTNTRVADFLFTPNTMTKILMPPRNSLRLSLDRAFPLFSAPTVYRLMRSLFAQFLGFCAETRDRLNCCCYYFRSRLFIGSFLCYQTHFHSISSTFRVMNKLIHFFSLRRRFSSSAHVRHCILSSSYAICGKFRAR